MRDRLYGILFEVLSGGPRAMRVADKLHGVEQEPRDNPDRIRVSDREREQVVEILGHAAAEGRLTLDEYTERAGSAYSARTRSELARLTDDLPAVIPHQPAPGNQSLAVPQPSATRPARVTPGPEHLVAIFGNESRKGVWSVPERLTAKSVFGDCHIELQEAQLQHPVTVIEATAIFGSVTVFVPEGVDVRLSGSAIFGAKDSQMRQAPAPGAPVIEVRTKVVFGAVTVRPPNPWGH